MQDISKRNTVDADEIVRTRLRILRMMLEQYDIPRDNTEVIVAYVAAAIFDVARAHAEAREADIVQNMAIQALYADQLVCEVDCAPNKRADPDSAYSDDGYGKYL